MPVKWTTLLVAAALVAVTFVPLMPSRIVLAKGKRDLALEAALRKETAKVGAKYAKEIHKVVKWCMKEGLKEEALAQIAVMRKSAPDYDDLDELQAEAEALEDAAITDEQKETLAKKLEKANEKNAKNLFDLAKKCMKVGLFTAAFDNINQVIIADPDHKKARKILGWEYLRKEERWVPEWDADMMKKHTLFGDEGWVPNKELSKWEEGLRPGFGKNEWLTIEEEKKVRGVNEYRAYEVESEHFKIQTNMGRSEAWRFAVLCEDFYREYFRFFIGFFDQKQGARLLFNKAELKSKHVIKYFPSRERYLTHVKAEHGNDQLLQESAGFYTGSGDKCSHFYYSSDASTMFTFYHELTHQLFAETKDGFGGSQGNNWVVEGIATYMETWIKVGDRWRPGERTACHEMETAQRYVSAQGIDLRSFTAIGHDEFHKQNRGLNYALSGALCHFLMHYDEGRYREDFIQVISAYYGGDLRKDSFPEYITVEGIDDPNQRLAKLQEQFIDYMKNLELTTPR